MRFTLYESQFLLYNTLYQTEKGVGVMGCIKCGRDVQGDTLFCQSCQAEMEKYPVKPNTYVRLPERREPSVFRRVVKRRTVNVDEQIRVLKHRVRDLSIGLVLCLILLAGLMYYITTQVMEPKYKPGQNYSVIGASGTSREAENTGTPEMD